MAVGVPGELVLGGTATSFLENIWVPPRQEKMEQSGGRLYPEGVRNTINFIQGGAKIVTDVL